MATYSSCIAPVLRPFRDAAFTDIIHGTYNTAELKKAWRMHTGFWNLWSFAFRRETKVFGFGFWVSFPFCVVLFGVGFFCYFCFRLHKAVPPSEAESFKLPCLVYRCWQNTLIHQWSRAERRLSFATWLHKEEPHKTKNCLNVLKFSVEFLPGIQFSPQHLDNKTRWSAWLPL